MVGSVLVESKNGTQVVKFLTALLKFINIALRILNDDEFDLKALGIKGIESVDIKYGMSDKCDATQGSFEKLGAQPCNCKVHIICNVKNQKVMATAAPAESFESLTTAQNQKAIRACTMNISQITMFVGVLSGDIHTVLCSLFMDKWRAEQPEFVTVWEKETTGLRKSNFSRGSMEPGFANDNNAEEPFKVDGTGRKQHHIASPGGFIEVWGDFVHRDSKRDVEFTQHPIVECGDWREAQKTMSKGLTRLSRLRMSYSSC